MPVGGVFLGRGGWYLLVSLWGVVFGKGESVGVCFTRPSHTLLSSVEGVYS